jgi:hypothetical protein
MTARLLVIMTLSVLATLSLATAIAENDKRSLMGSAASASSGTASCDYDATTRTNGATIKPAVKLVPDFAGHTVNFGSSRGTQYVDIVLNATPALPESVKPTDIRLQVLRRFSRVSGTLPTVSAPWPTFTNPVISPGRDRVTFTVCLDGSTLAPGSYEGNIYVEGPKGLSAATISITENAKNSALAGWLAGGALIAAFAFLLVRGMAARQDRHEQEHAKGMMEAVQTNNVQQQDALEENRPHPHLYSYFKDVVADLNWWLTSIVALGIAAGGIIATYSANPSWGADTWASVATVVGATFTAVGVQSVVTSLGKGVTN